MAKDRGEEGLSIQKFERLPEVDNIRKIAQDRLGSSKFLDQKVKRAYIQKVISFRKKSLFLKETIRAEKKHIKYGPLFE